MADVLATRMLGAPPEPKLEEDSKDFRLHDPAQEVDAKDANTPDNWVYRNPKILRLTGKHPLNCEAPMEDLMAAGFLTPVSLHLVGFEMDSGGDLWVGWSDWSCDQYVDVGNE